MLNAFAERVFPAIVLLMTMEPRDATLAYIDQASFLGLRALGRGPLIQLIWIFPSDVDPLALKTLNSRLTNTLLGRRILRSSLPFGRHSWIRSSEPGTIFIHKVPLQPWQVTGWADCKRQATIDPERGPGWQLDLAPMCEGGSVLLLTTTHSLVDGLGCIEAVNDAIRQQDRLQGLPFGPTGSGPEQIRRDLLLTLHSLPDILRAFVPILFSSFGRTPVRRQFANGAGGSHRHRLAFSLPPRRQHPVAPLRRAANLRSAPVAVPCLFIGLQRSEWDDRYRQLGGSSTALLTALAAQLASLIGRVDSHGRIQIVMPVSDRRVGDTRANALYSLRFHSPSVPGGASVRELSRLIRKQLSGHRRRGQQLHAVLTLIPYIPHGLVRVLETFVHGPANTVTVCNFSELDDSIGQAFRQPANPFLMRFIEDLTLADLDRLGGTLYMAAWSMADVHYLYFRVWQSPVVQTRADLSAVVHQTLNQFSLHPTLLI